MADTKPAAQISPAATPAADTPPAEETGRRPAAGEGGNTIRRVAASAHEAALMRFGVLLQLERRARQASRQELSFVIVNETRQLLPYRQAALWRVEGGKPVLDAVSGLAAPDHSSPYVVWINRFAAWRLAEMSREGIAETGPVEVTAESILSGSDADASPGPWLSEWREWIPDHVLCVPLVGRDRLRGFLCLFRESSFPEQEQRLFAYLAESYGQTMDAVPARRRDSRFGVRRFLWVIVLLALVGAMLVPQPQSVLAPAEVTARNPHLIRAGVDGVIDRFLVTPNERVRKGDPLFRLEDSQLQTRLAVARSAEEMARVELRQLQQMALSDPRSKARLPLAQGRMEQLAAETAYVETLLGRVVATSPIDGLALTENPAEWEGRPVSLGQKIMMVADPESVELEITLPTAEMLNLSVGDLLLFYPNVSPGSPVRATITFISYRASEMPGVGMAFHLRADFTGGTPPMLGLRGTARLYGDEVPLGLFILRRPVRVVRQWLGV